MWRQVLLELVLFLTPFVLYGALLLATKGSVVPDHWSPRMLAILAVIALVLMAGGLMFFEAGHSAPAGSQYVPAQVRDGVFTPGHFK